MMCLQSQAERRKTLPHGDFLNAARMALADSELRRCGLILGRAFAFWSLGRQADAELELARIDGADVAEAAEALRNFIRRDDVIILIPGAILSVFSGAPFRELYRAGRFAQRP